MTTVKITYIDGKESLIELSGMIAALYFMKTYQKHHGGDVASMKVTQ